MTFIPRKCLELEAGLSKHYKASLDHTASLGPALSDPFNANSTRWLVIDTGRPLQAWEEIVTALLIFFRNLNLRFWRNIVPSKWKEVIPPVPPSCEVYPSELKIKIRRGALSISFPTERHWFRFSTHTLGCSLAISASIDWRRQPWLSAILISTSMYLQLDSNPTVHQVTPWSYKADQPMGLAGSLDCRPVISLFASPAINLITFRTQETRNTRHRSPRTSQPDKPNVQNHELTRNMTTEFS